MKQARRRKRQFDQLATPEGVRLLLDELRKAAPGLIPIEEERVISLLNSARYHQKARGADSAKGRPSQWTSNELKEVTTVLRALLDHETDGRVSLQTFIGQHLRLLTYPPEVANALQLGQINKQEASSLARLTGERLATTEVEAQQLRLELLNAHLATHGSQNQLREKVKEVLGENSLFSRETLALGMQKTDSLLEFNRQDVKHVFFETMRDLFYAIRMLNPADLKDEDIVEFMNAADSLSNTLKAIELRITQRQSKRIPAPDSTSIVEDSKEIQIVTDPLTGQVTYKFR